MEVLEFFNERFCPEPNTGCWLWTGNLDRKDYGRVSYRISKIAGDTFAHRVSFSLFKEKVRKGTLVCHSCDTPACVNPEHLFSGTHQDNHTDRNKKERQARHERSGSSKLCKEQVLQIRNLVSSGLSQSALAKRFGVCKATIYYILHGISWKDL